MAKQIQIKIPETRKEFINFFNKIPEHRWCVGRMTDDNGRHCAWGHMTAFIDAALNEAKIETGSDKRLKEFRKIQGSFVKKFKKVYKNSTDMYHLMDVNDDHDPEFNSKKLKTKSTKKRVMAFLRNAK